MAAQHASTQNANGKFSAQAGLAIRPALHRGILVVVVKLTEVPNDGMAHILGHLHRHACIVQAHDVHAGWHVQLQQGIDTRANVEHVLQLRLLVNETLRRRPHHGMVCQLGGLPRLCSLPFPDVNARQCLAKALEPGFSFGVGAAKNDFHKGRVYASLSNSAPSEI